MTAVVSTLMARPCTRRGKTPVRFTGPVSFDRTSTVHINEVVVPLTNSILSHLGRKALRYEISVANIGAASAQDMGASLSGFSADAPLLIATLSAALGIPVPSDVVCTGHIASPQGDIRMVRNLPAKLEAAVTDPSIGRVVCPSFARDASLKALSPDEAGKAEAAVIQAKADLRISTVTDVAGLLHAMLPDDAVILASLMQGYFGHEFTAAAPGTPVEAAARLLVENGETRFWRHLEHLLIAGDGERAKELLHARARFQIDRKVYPTGLGAKLLQALRSLPPATRRIKLTFPLLPMDTCIRLSQFAGESDHEDVRRLYDAAFGRTGAPPEPGRPVAARRPGDDGAAALEAVLSEIDPDTLAEKIERPIDTARAGWTMDSVTAESEAEFHDVITGLYLRLERHRGAIVGAPDLNSNGKDALGLLERTFARQGGHDAALTEAKRGGYRYVLDAMTDYYKMEEKQRHVNWVFKRAKEDLDDQEMLALVRALTERMGPHLPPELRDKAPEQLVKHWEPLTRAYVHSMDTLKQYLRRL